MIYLRKYNSHEAYSGDYNSIKGQNVCVSLVKDECTKTETTEAKTRVFFKNKGYNAWAGDLLCWNTVEKKWQIHQVDHDETKYTAKKLTELLAEKNLVADAVCVVPACHTDNGKARWCALNDVAIPELSTNTDKTGERQYYKWGYYDRKDVEVSKPSETLVDELGCYGSFPLMAGTTNPNDERDVTYDNSTVGEWITDGSELYMTGEVGPAGSLLNPISTWGANDNDISSSYNIEMKWSPVNGCTIVGSKDLDTMPWAYATDGVSKNPAVFQYYYNAGSGYNTFMDTDGLRNTQILLKLSPTGNEYPAALAASLYSQEYSPAGTWYLPSAGEIMYLIARWYTIQHTLFLLNPVCLDDGYTYNVDSNTASPLDCDYVYWSSSQYSADYAVNLCTDYGGLYWNNKYYGYLVRPFRSF